MAYTTIDDPSAHLQTVLYTGNGSSQSITFGGNSDLQPDMLWTKNRNDTFDPIIRDTSRGISERLLVHATDGAGGATGTTAMNSDGFSLDSTNTVNSNSNTFVAWGWKANGGTTTTNDASATSVGTIDSVYQANTTAGFSILTYTGTGSAGTVAHGLGAAPKVIITKRRDDTEDWVVYHQGQGNDRISRLNTADAAADLVQSGAWNDTSPTSTVFSLGNGSATNGSGRTIVAYCFAEKQGYSKFGSYTGNGNANGPFVYTGFKPAYILGKNITNDGNHWFINDHKRGVNGGANWLKADSNAAELTNLTNPDILSNGFKIRNSDAIYNTNGSSYIYMAFAENPFVTSKGAAVTAK